MQPISFLRRLAILLVALGLIINATLYYSASKTLKKENIAKFYKIIITLEEKKIARKIFNQLKKQNYSVKIFSKAQSKSKVIGFVVVQDFPRTKPFESVKKLLIIEGFKPREIPSSSQDRFKLQIGPVFKSQAKAQKLSNKIRAKGVKFIIEPAYKEIPFTFWCVEVDKLEKSETDILKTELENNFAIKKDIQLIPCK